jgi:hypothetical protein
MKLGLATLFLLLLVFPTASPGQEGDRTAALTRLLEDSKAEATRIRGLEFLSETPIGELKADQFKEIIWRDIGLVFGEGPAFGHMETLLKIVRILPAETDLSELIETFLSTTIAAKYDPFDNRIGFLRNFNSKSTMVHELVHALQDQHFNLVHLVMSDDFTFDRMLAIGALVEGDAENVQRCFETQMMLHQTPIPVIRAFGEVQVRQYLARMGEFPMGIARCFIFQYLDGLIFNETIRRTGEGYEAVNRMYRDPPVSTEQVLHPEEKYLVRDHPTRISDPKAPPGWQVLIANTFGELGTSIVMKEHLGEKYETAIAEGWDGDRVVLLGRSVPAVAGEADTQVLAWLTTWDTTADADQFEAAAAAMIAVRRPGLEPVTEEKEGKRIRQTGDEKAVDAVVRVGDDVVLLLGAPRADLTAILTPILAVEMAKTVVRTRTFGLK